MNPLIQSLEKPKSKIFIYALRCPDTDLIRYVGQTTQGFNRIRQHYYHCLKLSKITNKMSPSNLWIHSLKKDNKIFKVTYLEYIEDILSLNDKEIFYINKHKSDVLLNIFINGTPNLGTTCSYETRKLISERTKKGMESPVLRAYLSAINKGNKVILTEEGRKKIRDNPKKKIIRLEDNKIYNSITEAALEINVNVNSITAVLKKRKLSIKGHSFIYWSDYVSTC